MPSTHVGSAKGSPSQQIPLEGHAMLPQVVIPLPLPDPVMLPLLADPLPLDAPMLPLVVAEPLPSDSVTESR